MVKAVELTEKNGYFQVSDGERDVFLKGVKTLKNFKCFLELGPQTGHDSGLVSFYKEKFKGSDPRPGYKHPGKVEGNTQGLKFYKTHGEFSAKIATAYFGWASSQVGTVNANAFTQNGYGNNLSIQRFVLENGYSYEITVWWEANGIYTAFHCYPNKKGETPKKQHYLFPLR